MQVKAPIDFIGNNLKTETRSCPVCLSTKFHILSHQGIFEFCHCCTCGMLYTRNPLTVESKRFYYEAMADHRTDTMKIYNAGFYTLANQIKSVPVYSVALRAIRDIFSNGFVNIVDFGCAGGLFLLGCQVVEDAHNIDHPPRFNICGAAFDFREKIDTERYVGCPVFMIEEVGEKLQNWADVVTMFNVLEHVNNLSECLNTVRRILRNDGLLVVDVPNNQVTALRSKILNRWTHLDLGEHINFFTPQTLDYLMISQRFSPLRRLTGLIQGASGFGIKSTIKQYLRWLLASILFHTTLQKVQIFTNMTVIYKKM